MPSLFSQIISGDIPSHKIYEDEATYAFLDINPRHEGHALVVPKREVDYVFDLPQNDYEALWDTARAVAEGLKRAIGCARVVVLVLGYEVPHAHVHLIPTDRLEDFPMPPVDQDAQRRLEETAHKIREAMS